jgi:hypothetical protein
MFHRTVHPHSGLLSFSLSILKSDKAFAQVVAYVIGICIILSFWRHHELRGVSKLEILRNTLVQSFLTALAYRKLESVCLNA